MDVTPELFWSWDRPQQQAYLAGATMRKAEAVGVRAICGSCGQPLPFTLTVSHQCDPEHVAECVAKLGAST